MRGEAGGWVGLGGESERERMRDSTAQVRKKAAAVALPMFMVR